MNVGPLIAGIAALLLLTLNAALVVAGRGLSRLRLRAWAESAGLNGEEGDTAEVEITFLAIGLARQISLLATAVLATHAVSSLVSTRELVLSVAVVIVLYLLFDKLLPYWLVSLATPGRVLRVAQPWVTLVRLLLGPAADLLSRITLRARTQPAAHGEPVAPADLGAFLDLAEEEGLVSDSEESLLRGVADFEEAVVREVMTPRVDVVSIDAEATLADLRGLIGEHRLSRVPVIREDLDHVVGVVHLKDLVAALDARGSRLPVTEIARPPWFVPETKRVSELLGEFQHRQVQLAIVVDEYGGTAGIVTLEDVLEEIVGEIQDEDEPPEELVELKDGALVASGKAEIEDVEEALGVSVQEGEFHTVGGMVFTHLGQVPEPGESFQYGNLRVEVLEADDRRIHRVRITAG